MKVSLIFTIKNEESNIELLLNSIENQTRTPDEIVIVDGGSSDNTLNIIKIIINNYTIPIKLISKQNINISKGRNIAIKQTKNDIIACTDAGCKLDPNWLKNLTNPFEKNSNLDIITGNYKPYGENDFENIVAALLFPKIGKFKTKVNKFLPSSRSVAFRKKCWEEVKGYPENLYTAEDTLFDIKLKKKGFNFEFAENAIVFWRMRPNIKSLFKQYFNYRRGDGRAKLFFPRYWGPKYVIYALGFLLIIYSLVDPASLFVLLILSLIYLSGHTLIVYINTKIKKSLLLVPIIVLAIDISGLIGYFFGLMDRLRYKNTFRG
jgi:glycosyltransferase involved in cell wall biosynthesis